ncbi:MAG TPA: hypothetical protein VHS59_10550 [Bacillota bacterium]|nr:hypothetical protein [Bacillota bacterium]
MLKKILVKAFIYSQVALMITLLMGITLVGLAFLGSMLYYLL